jgi:hypothetical protein
MCSAPPSSPPSFGAGRIGVESAFAGLRGVLTGLPSPAPRGNT